MQTEDAGGEITRRRMTEDEILELRAREVKPGRVKLERHDGSWVLYMRARDGQTASIECPSLYWTIRTWLKVRKHL